MSPIVSRADEIVVGKPKAQHCEESIESKSTCSGSSSAHDSAPEKLQSEISLRAFHHSNIHEQRVAAKVARAIPLALFVGTICISLTGLVWKPMLLLWTCAVLNVCMWLWLVSYALFSLQSTWSSSRQVAAASQGDTEGQVNAALEAADAVHVIVLPNYKEDDSILVSTLTALEQSHGSLNFRIMLAMEAREGSNANDRSARLTERYAGKFARFSTAVHPLGLFQEHITGDSVNEVPGKSSNLRWAVQQAFDECAADGVDMDRVVLTCADADCIFHPDYFVQLGGDFAAVKKSSDGECWAMWQAPQLPFRNYTASPAPSRLWGYVSSVYETGGVGGLQFGGYHMTFSSFSLPLTLAMSALPWDGDVIADDHHCYLKCFFYSVYKVALEKQQLSNNSKRVNPPLQLRPIMLPVKSTSVEADNCVKSWKARFNQACRHTQGVAEMSYALLAAWRLLRTLPLSAYSLSLLCKLLRVVLLPICVNMLPICQSIPFALESLYWMYHGMGVPQCPSSSLYKLDDPQFYFCWFAGGFNLGWPMLVPIGLVVVASFSMICASFLQPAAKVQQDATTKKQLLWMQDDGQIKPTCGSKKLTLAKYILSDFIFLLPIVMPIYGVLPAIMSYWNVFVRGNRFNFVSAAKGAPVEAQKPAGPTKSQTEVEVEEAQL